MSSQTATANSLVKSYQSINEEGEIVSKIKYVHGRPIQYRFNGQKGGFNKDEEYLVGEIATKGRVEVGETLTIQPIGFRMFKDKLFARKDDVTNELRAEDWAEIFFVNMERKVCSLMFNNSSYRALEGVMTILAYNERNLTQVVLNISCKEAKSLKGAYYIASFKVAPATSESMKIYTEFCEDYSVYQASTIQQSAQISLASKHYPLHLFGITQEVASKIFLPIAA
jgi:hypothetical protein